jgi:hypothetical protein
MIVKVIKNARLPLTAYLPRQKPLWMVLLRNMETRKQRDGQEDDLKIGSVSQSDSLLVTFGMDTI